MSTERLVDKICDYLAMRGHTPDVSSVRAWYDRRYKQPYYTNPASELAGLYTAEVLGR